MRSDDIVNDLVKMSLDGYQKLINKIYGENNDINTKDVLLSAISECSLFIIDKENKPIGFIGYQIMNDQMIFKLWGVKKNYRGTKLGLEMTDELIDIAKDMDISSIVLKPNEIEKAIIRFARSRGFKKVESGNYEKQLKETKESVQICAI